jgi:hypothetical protein
MSKIIFNGTGVAWFPMPRQAISPSSLSKMNVPPELRLYLVLLSESSRPENQSHVVTLDNNQVKGLTGLDRNYLLTARKALAALGFIRWKRAGMSAYRYEILNTDGRPLSDKTIDEWGMDSHLEFA